MKKIIICNKCFNKKKIKNLLEWFLTNHGNEKTKKLLEKVKKIGFHYSRKSGISLGLSDLIIPKLKKNLIINTNRRIKKNQKKLSEGKINKIDNKQKTINVWNNTNETIKKETIENIKKKNIENPIYIMICSGARGNISQVKQLLGLRGIMSDSQGNTINIPIKKNFKEGLTRKDYFISCYGARKGIIDTALKTANSGYLTRKLIYASQNIITKQSDCLTKKGTLIKIKIKNKNNYLKTKEKIIGTIINEEILNKKNFSIINKGQDICNYTAKKIINAKNYILIRTPTDCKINIGICQLCYGWNLTNNKIIKIGEPVGILASQSIGEPGTQLTMRTFHTGGIFYNKVQKLIQSPTSGKLIYSKKNLSKPIKNQTEKISITKKNKSFFIKKGYLNYKIYLSKYTKIFINKKHTYIFKKQIIAEIPKWKKKKIKINNENINSSNSGQVLIEKKKTKSKITVLTGKILSVKKISEIENQIIKYNSKKKIIKRKKNNLLNYILLKKINCTKNTKKKNKINTYQIYKRKNQKIVINKNINKKTIILPTNITKFTKKNNINKYFGQIIEKRKNRHIIKKNIRYNIKKNTFINVQNNAIILKKSTLYKTKNKKQKTKDIIEGLPRIEEILEAKKKIFKKKLNKYFNLYKKSTNNLNLATKKAFKKIQIKLTNAIQKVYELQDVKISRKHIEIIVKQITSKIIITQTNIKVDIIEGEIINFNKIVKINKAFSKIIKYEPVLIGISKIPSLNESFLSAACFQETTKNITEAAIFGKIDWIKGLKENIILGNLLPIGTGFK